MSNSPRTRSRVRLCRILLDISNSHRAWACDPAAMNWYRSRKNFIFFSLWLSIKTGFWVYKKAVPVNPAETISFLIWAISILFCCSRFRS